MRVSYKESDPVSVTFGSESDSCSRVGSGSATLQKISESSMMSKYKSIQTVSVTVYVLEVLTHFTHSNGSRLFNNPTILNMEKKPTLYKSTPKYRH